MLHVALFMIGNFLVGISGRIQCDCGYGGLCLEVPRAVITNCSYCSNVSSGFYENDGHTIVNHCASNPCVLGRCVQTFGGFFCKCPFDRIGHRCEMLRSGKWYEDFRADEDLYIFYQVQPNLVGENSFTVVYWSQANTWISASSERIRVRPVITISDGRIYYPNHHFVPSDVKAYCIAQASSRPEVFDLRVCELLPDGIHEAFTFEVVEGYSSELKFKNELIISGFGRVGVTDTVTVQVQLWLGTEHIVIYKQIYTIFSYFDRASYRCVIDHSFIGCSSNYNEPVVTLVGEPLELLAIDKRVQCEGVITVKTEWRSQKIIAPHDLSEENMTGYSVPTYIIGSRNSYSMYRPPFLYGRGLVMFEFMYTLRGEPPNEGSDLMFTKIGRCWVRYRAGSPSVGTEGGSFRTMSCLSTLALPIISYNRNFQSSDLTIFVHCNVTSDVDCEKKKVTAPMLRKTRKAACGSYYKFYLDVHYLFNGVKPTFKTFVTVIHFVEKTEELSITCLSNCFPYINPNKRVILIAESEPYSPAPVRWEVETEGQTVTRRYGEVLSFRPLTASRILRLNGQDMANDRRRISNGSFTVFADALGITATLNTSCDNIQTDVLRGFGGLFFDPANECVNLVAKSSHLYKFRPVTYLIYQVNLKAKDELLLKVTQYEQNLKNIKPDWNILRICLRDVWNTENCSEATISNIKYSDPNSRLVKLEDLYDDFDDFNLDSLLAKTIILLMQSLDSKNDTYFSWSCSLVDRTKIVDLLLQIEFINHQSIKRMCFIVSMLTYSAAGNGLEFLHPFLDEALVDEVEVVSWLKLRVKSLQLLGKVMDSLIALTGRTYYIPLLPLHYIGSQRRLVFRTWSLAYHQEFALENLMKSVVTSENRYYKGEAFYYVFLADYLLYASFFDLSQFLAKRTLLYEGLRVFGYGNVISYTVRTSYIGIEYCLDRFLGNTDPDDSFADYIFQPKRPLMRWVEWLMLELPPPSEELVDNEYIFVVAAVRFGLKIYNDQFYHTPLVNLYLADRNYKNVETLHQGYNISIPYLNGNNLGTLYPVTTDIGIIMKLGKINSRKELFVSVIKIPPHLRYRRLKIILEPGVKIKAKGSVNEIPEYEDVIDSPELPVLNSSNGLEYSVLDIEPVGAQNPFGSKIYLAILPGRIDKPNVPTTLKMEKSLYSCKTFNYANFEFRSCEELYQPMTLEQQFFNCSCSNFGLVYVAQTRLSSTSLFVEGPDLVVPFFVDLESIVVVGAALVLIILVMSVAFLKDRQRIAETLIYMEDNYVEDNYLLIVGVYTSLRCRAGTRCKVAIKVIGSKSSSRAHLLKSSEALTLQAGQDDWFVLTTNELLGRIKSVQLWVDFNERDDWFCTKILLYDVNSGKWFFVKVNEWIPRVDSIEENKLYTFDAKELESPDNSLRNLPFGFCEHFSKEVCDHHLLASAVLLHRRNLKTCFMMGSLLLIKLFSLFLWIWFLEEVAYVWIYDAYYLDNTQARRLVGLTSRTIQDASISAVLSRIFTAPIVLLYKAAYVSRFVQKRTTNPLYLAIRTAKDFSSPKRSIFSLRGRSSSVGSRGTPKSTKTSFNKPFDTKFGLQKGWRLIITLWFGPSQFRCVNVDASVFTQRVFTKLAILRIGTCSVVFVLFLALVYIEFGTEFGRKTEPSAFLLLTAFVFDMLIISPSFMLVASLITYFALKASNKELYMVCEDVKFKHPPQLGFKQYINVATKKEYKPSLITEIQLSINRRQKTVKLMYLLNHWITVLIWSLCIFTVRQNAADKFYIFKSLTEVVSQPTTLLDRTSNGLENVNTRRSVEDFIFTNLAVVTDRWYNGKFISPDKRTWEIGGYSQSLGAATFIILFRANDSRTYYLGVDILDHKDIFPQPCGYLSDDSQSTDPRILLPGTTLKFHKFNPFSITGKSGESYPFQGHNFTVPLSTDWNAYYATLRTVTDSVVNRVDRCDSRALLFLWNMVNVFNQKMYSVNVLIEFLPIGFQLATVEINAFRYQISWYNHVSNAILSLVFLWNICFVALMFSINKRNIIPDRILNSFFLIGSVGMTIIKIVSWEVKYKHIQRVIYDPPDVFRDLHPVHVHERVRSYNLAAVMIATTLIMAFLVLRTIGKRLLKMTKYCISCAAFMMAMTVLDDACTAGLRHFHIISYSPVFSRIEAIVRDCTPTVSIGLSVAIFFFSAVLFKLATATVIIASIYAEDEDKNDGKFSTKKNPTATNLDREVGEGLRVREIEPKKTEVDKRIDNKLTFIN